ncbi:hypothetical protein EMCRGX_G000701 [Ephydatia muelleri]
MNCVVSLSSLFERPCSNVFTTACYGCEVEEDCIFGTEEDWTSGTEEDWARGTEEDWTRGTEEDWTC